MNPPRRPLRPTTPTPTPTAALPAPVVETPAKPQPTTASLFALFVHVDSRPRLKAEAVSLVNQIRSELGLPPRQEELPVEVEKPVGAPKPAVAAPIPPRPIGRVMPKAAPVDPEPVVDERESYEDEPNAEDDALVFGSAAFATPEASEPVEDIVSGDFPGRGIDPSDDWLDPFGDKKQPPRIGEENQAELERQHEAQRAARPRPRVPMTGGSK